MHFDLISNTFLCRWNETFDMVQSNKSGGLFGSSWARAYVRQNISGQFRACMQNFLITLIATTFSFRNILQICCAYRGNFCERSVCNFSKTNCVCKHSCVFILCWYESHTVFEKATAVRKFARDGVASKRSITHAIL